MKIYFIGIAGAGTMALAFMCKKLGYEVLGVDQSPDELIHKNLKNLESQGITVYDHFTSDHITEDVDLVIHNAALTMDTPAAVELQRAKDLGKKIGRRELLLDEIAKLHEKSLGVCGTHGKTTTSSLLAHCLIKMDENPSYSLGGTLLSTGKISEIGDKKYFVWEADEYSNAFHGVHLTHTILNNIEYDHPDFFKTEKDYIDSFKFFIENNISEAVIANADNNFTDEVIANVKDKIKVVTFGKKESTDYVIGEAKFDVNKTIFSLCHNDIPYEIDMALNGWHNVYNATAVFALLFELGFEPEKILFAISTFTGSGRRFEKLYENNHVLVISDYAHHPTAIKTTIDGAKALGYPITAIFEPHQYTRLTTLYKEFCESFSEADNVIILPIFASRDKNVPLDFSKQFSLDIKNDHSEYVDNYDEILNRIKSENGEKRVYLFMTAGGNLDDYLRKNLQ